MSEIKAIGFDYGGVIAGMTAVAYGKQIAAELGISFEDYKKLYHANNHKINVEGMTWDEFWRFYVNEAGKPEKYDAVMMISREYSESLEKINPKILELVDDLRSKGYKLGLLSNNSKKNGEILREKGVDKHFDVFHISEETGLMKPSIEAYRYFSDALGVKMNELIFIDDSPKSLSTAQECGFTPLLFETYEDLLSQLKGLGVTLN